MALRGTAFEMTTIIMIALGLVVFWVRFKNKMDSNLPLLFYVMMLIYANSIDGQFPERIIYIALVLGLMIRFEFMNNAITKLVSFAEYVAVGAIIYNCTILLKLW